MKNWCWNLLLAIAMCLSAFAADVEWDIEVGLDNSIYPSLIIATSTLQEDEEQDPTNLGDPWGLTGVNIKNPAPDSRIRVEISSGKLIQPSVWEGVLKKKGETYLVCPLLKYDYDTLLSVRQPFPEIVTAKVTLNGELLPEKNKRVPVRSINDCVLGFGDDDDWSDTSWLIAAYVNENHPFVDVLLREALDAGGVDSFAGYQKDRKDVQKEMKAIYNALQQRGFRYSNITRASGESQTVASQHIRLIGDQIRSSQANCVEGSVLFASIFRKLEMDPFLVSVPGHMFVGVYLDEEHERHLCIETTMLGGSTFEEAVKTGNQQFKEAADYFEDENEPDYAMIDVAAARQLGVMPIREAHMDIPPAYSLAPPPARTAEEDSARTRPPGRAPEGERTPRIASGLETVALKKMQASIDLPDAWETEMTKDDSGDPLFMANDEDEELVITVGILGENNGTDLRAVLKEYVKGIEMKMDGAAESVKIQGGEALLGHASGKMEGTPVSVKILVAASDETVYVVQALGLGKAYRANEALLDRIVRSFKPQ